MSSSPPPAVPLCGARQALEKDPERSPEGQIMLARETGEFDGVRRGARRDRRRISSNMAACTFPYARVPIWARVAIRASALPTRETARPTSPSGHKVSAR